MARVDWTVDQLQQAIEEVVSGERLVEVTSNEGPMHVLLKYPSRSSIRRSEVMMKKKMVDAVSDNFQTEEQMLKIIQDRGIWTEKDDKIVQAIQFQIDKIKEKMSLSDIDPHVKLHYEGKAKKLEEELFQAEYKKEVMLVNTAERKARQEKYEYLVWACSYDPLTDERLWDNYLTYCRVRDLELKNLLLGEFLKYLGGRRTEEIRYIARSNLWRISYVIAQKTNTPLFPNAVIDLTPDQTNLAWWAGYYDGIYQMMPEDQPDDATIEDDEALDNYMEELHKERSRERQDARRNKGNPFGSKSARNMQTQLIMRNNPDYFDLEYDKPPSHGDGLERRLQDEAPAGSKAAKRKTAPIKGSKRFKRKLGD